MSGRTRGTAQPTPPHHPTPSRSSPAGPRNPHRTGQERHQHQEHLLTAPTHRESSASSLPAITAFMQQPAQKQQLQTPTGLTEVKTHRALLFRQTQIAASSADCSRDEQTHINYRLTLQFTSPEHRTSAKLSDCADKSVSSRHGNA